MPGRATTRLVECYWPDITDDKLHAATGRITAANGARSAAGAPLTYLGALLMPDDETVFFLFDGRDEDVRVVAAEAQLPFDRIAASRWISSHTSPPLSSRRRRPIASPGDRPATGGDKLAANQKE